MNELESKIKYYAQKYYTDGSSELTDEEFDKLVDKLKFEYPDSLLLRVGWGYDVENDTTPGAKRHHLYSTIGSLDKCHNLKELGKDFINVPLDLSTKLDGLSVVLYYENSQLKYALTRGDSRIGIDITDKVLKINSSLSHTIKKFTGAIRGEILMSYSNFEKFQQVHPEAKNPRNSTAGVINGKDTFDDLKYLDIVFYTLVHDSGDVISNVMYSREYLSSLFNKIEIVKHHPIMFTGSLDDVGLIECMNNFRDFLYEDYPADGIVITKQEIQNIEGTYSYDSKAFKFPAESKITRIVDIEWNMSKTKNAVPRILLEPVELSGTTVSACSGFNAKYILDNNLGVDSIVEVHKSGEIIPTVINIVKPTYASIPFNCPDCGEPLEWRGVNLLCPNPDCSNSIEQDLLVWLENLVPTDNLGDTLKLKFINQLVSNGLLESMRIESIMTCKVILDETTPSSQFNTFAKMWNNLHDESFTFDSVHSLIACNIPRIGDLTAIKFSKFPKIIFNLLETEDIESYDSYELTASIGDANGRSVINNIHKLKRLNLIKDRINWDVKDENKSRGKVAVTGKLSVKRSDFEKEIKKFGYELGDISKDTLFLITDSVNSGSSKNKKADQLGIQKITELEFRRSYMK